MYHHNDCTSIIVLTVNTGHRSLALWTLSLSLLLTTLLSPSSHAETINTPFYKQLRHAESNRYRPASNGLLQQVMASNMMFNASPIDPIQDDDMAFHYLWMQQHQENYKYKGGGAAIGKLLRMSVKGLYKSYTHSRSATRQGGEDVSARFDELDYRLRLSSDKVRLRVKYEF